MKYLNTTLNRFRQIFLISIISLSVLSCAGGAAIATAGISGTGIVFGVITGFGSIFVNGVKYEVDEATAIDVDGKIINAASHKEDLKIGMVVKMETTSFDDGTFEANNVVYDDSIEGPVTSTVEFVTGKTKEKEFTVMGVQVVINDSSTSFHDSSSGTPAVSFDNLKQGDVIEVSGFEDASGKISATLVEKKSELSQTANTPVPVEIHIAIPDPAPAPGPTGSFTVNGLTVNYDANTEFDDLPNGLLPGLAVEVKGLLDVSANTIQATEIENEDDDGIGSNDPNISVSVQGPMVNFTDVNSEFSVSGVRVLINTSAVPQAILNQLVEGLNVEVEGMISGNVLIADEVEIREGNSEYKAFVQSRDLTAQTLNISYPDVTGSILLRINGQSKIEDENRNPIPLSEIQVNDDVKVHAREIDSEWTVVSLQRKRNEFNSYEISGEIDAIDPSNTITIDGLTFTLDATIPPPPGLPDWPNLAPGSLVELEDNGKDGDIDVVSLYLP